MNSKSDYFLKKTLGEDFFESLQKFELWKPGTRTTIDHEEVKTALQIVPRTLMAMLIRELVPMEIGETKEIHLPVTTVPAIARVTKHERDVYSGDVEQENKKVVDFKFRSIPGVGLVIMSAFELYDMDSLVNEHIRQKPVDIDQNLVSKVQSIIDERLALHDLVGKVVDKKIMEKDAIQQLILARITEDLDTEKKKKTVAQLSELARTTAPMSDPYFQGMANGVEVANAVVNDKEPNFVEAPKKGSPLKEFLDKRKKKPEFSIQMAKGESVDCPDCGKNVFNGDVFSGCICLGEDREKKIYIRKTEEGLKVRFGKGWDVENIEMLLDILRTKHG